MVGWHHQLNGHEFEQTPRDGKGQGSLVCWRPLDHKESDTTEHVCAQDVILIISRIRIIKNIVLAMLNNNECNPIYLFNLTISV